MPSKDELCILEGSGELPAGTLTLQTNNNIVAQDVEKLVFEMKENLRLNVTAAPLKVGPTYNHHTIHNKRSRPSPYKVPCRSLSEPACDNCVKFSRSNCQTCGNKHRNIPVPSDTTSDDPYAMLQELIKSQSLIKEAVRRLQSVDNSQRKRHFRYESDDSRSPPLHECGEDSRSPMLQLCELHL